MDCSLYKNLLSSYIDKDINEIDKIELEKHLLSCEECMNEYKALLSVVKSCNEIEDAELPSDFYLGLHEKLCELNVKKSKIDFLKVNWKWASGIAAVFIIAVISISQLPNLMHKNAMKSEMSPAGEAGYGYTRGAAPASDVAFPQEAPQFSIMAQTTDSGGVAMNQAADDSFSVENFDEPSADNKMMSKAKMEEEGIVAFDLKQEIKEAAEPEILERKIIVSGSVSLEVVDFDNSMKFITDLAKRYGGYVENSYVDNNSTFYVEGKHKRIKSGNAAIRIPSDKFEDVFAEVKSLGEVTNENTNSSDISDMYYDTATRIENLKVQENRLRELLVMAKNIEEILKIENELNRVRNDIDLMSTDIRRWDKQVSLSSLYIDLREVSDAKISNVDVSTTWGKAYKGFVKTINNLIAGAEHLFIFLVAFLPYIILLSTAAFVIYIIIRRRRKL